MDKETEARVNTPVPFQEFPKMLHNTDGRQLTVNNKAEEEKALRDPSWHPSPGEAADEKTKRDEAEATREAQKHGKAAADAAAADKAATDKAAADKAKGK